MFDFQIRVSQVNLNNVSARVELAPIIHSQAEFQIAWIGGAAVSQRHCGLIIRVYSIDDTTVPQWLLRVVIIVIRYFMGGKIHGSDLRHFVA